MNKLQTLLLTFGLKRLASKSPKEYTLLTNLCVLVGTIVGLFIMAAPELELLLPASAAQIASAAHFAPSILAALTGAGLISKTTTTDPKQLLEALPGEIADVKADVTNIADTKKN